MIILKRTKTLCCKFCKICLWPRKKFNKIQVFVYMSLCVHQFKLTTKEKYFYEFKLTGEP